MLSAYLHSLHKRKFVDRRCVQFVVVKTGSASGVFGALARTRMPQCVSRYCQSSTRQRTKPSLRHDWSGSPLVLGGVRLAFERLVATAAPSATSAKNSPVIPSTSPCATLNVS